MRSLFDFFTRFHDEEAARDHLVRLRWPDGPQCLRCKSKDLRMNSPKIYCCRSCRREFTVITRTHLHKSNVPLRTWLLAYYLWAGHTQGMSSAQLSTDIGVNIDTALSMLRLVRGTLKPNDVKLSGIVEMDEMFFRGQRKRYKRSYATVRKEHPIIGMRQRGEGGRVVIVQVSDRRASTVNSLVKKYIAPGSTIYTDQHKGYTCLPEGYRHDTVNHTNREWVRGEVHTNNVENTWSRFKFMIRNNHQRIGSKYVQLYCDEFVYRFNTRDMSIEERMTDALCRALVTVAVKCRAEYRPKRKIELAIAA